MFPLILIQVGLGLSSEAPLSRILSFSFKYSYPSCQLPTWVIQIQSPPSRVITALLSSCVYHTKSKAFMACDRRPVCSTIPVSR